VGELVLLAGCSAARIGCSDGDIRQAPLALRRCAMATKVQLYTAEDLWEMPGDEPWEIWEGELRKVPSAGEAASALAAWMVVLISLYVRPRRLGVVTGADGTYILARDPDTVLVPDVAFTRRERLPADRNREKYVPVPPDLVVEVVSPSDRSDRPGQIAAKTELYRKAGVSLVWWVREPSRTVTVYRDGELVGECGEGDELDGGDVLPGFRLAVAEIFAEA
jgi:Uma2 family endonuclease